MSLNALRQLRDDLDSLASERTDVENPETGYRALCEHIGMDDPDALWALAQESAVAFTNGLPAREGAQAAAIQFFALGVKWKESQE